MFVVVIDGTQYREGVTYIDSDGDRWIIDRALPNWCEGGQYYYYDPSRGAFVVTPDGLPVAMAAFGTFRPQDANLQVAP